MKSKVISILFIGLFSVTIALGQTNTFPASGNVGIGTTSPSANLDVRGKINSEKFQIRTPSIGLWFNITSINGSNRLDFNRVSNGDNPLMSILANGNVGVGTTSPFQKLQVHGKALIGSNNGAADIVDHLKFGNASGYLLEMQDHC